MAKGLTPKREKFCQEMAKLGNQRHAYKKAFNCQNMKDETIDNNAYKLMQNNEIKTRIQELSDKIESKNIADAQEIQETLTKLMRGEIQEECVTVEQAIDAYTIGSAEAEFAESWKGRIAPGYVADLVVLDRDIFTVPHDEIKDIRPLCTIFNGNVVYQK